MFPFFRNIQLEIFSYNCLSFIAFTINKEQPHKGLLTKYANIADVMKKEKDSRSCAISCKKVFPCFEMAKFVQYSFLINR